MQYKHRWIHMSALQSTGTPHTKSSVRLVHLEEVMEQTGLGRTKVYELLGEKKFPEPVKIGRSSRWLDDEISAWIESLREARNSTTSRAVRQVPPLCRPDYMRVQARAAIPVAHGTVHTRNLG